MVCVNVNESLCSWWKTAQALAAKCLLAFGQIHGGKNQPWTGLTLMVCLPCVFVVVVVAHIYPSVADSIKTVNIGRFANFSLQ